MGPEVQKYPFLTVDEWSGVCKSFVATCKGSIGEHDGWTSISHHKLRGVEYIRITRTLMRTDDGSADGEEQDADMISDCGGAFEEFDEEMAPLPHQEHGKIADTLLAVTYDVLLSPSYCVPVLHFSVNDSTGGPIIDLASVYPDVVPSSYRSQVRDTGVIGAISMTDHPLTGLPTFFVHPCNTAEAMRHVTADDSVPVSDYLFLWMGIISSSVGLTTPSPALAAVWTEE